MRFSHVIAASLVAPLVAAHDGAPKIFGLGGSRIANFKSRDINSHAARAVRAKQGAKLNARQGGASGRCGPEGGGASCDEGYCCSGSGWCGIGPDYCMAPDCLFNYGPACDANKLPSGGSTRNIPRPQVGKIAYGGEGVYFCTKPGTVAITYDDGPYIYTNDVLDQFAAYGFKATFFITGVNINKGQIDDPSLPWSAMITRMITEGHQVASHTWSHQDLSKITHEQRMDQLIKNEMAFSNILGKFPTYMRPPYSSCDEPSGCWKDMKDLGYVVSYFNLDTDDYNNLLPELIQNAKNNYANAINPSNPASDEFLAIAHDIHQQTAQNLTGFMLDLLVSKGYRGVTMGECLGEPEAAWYRTATGRVATSSVFTPPTRTPTASASSTSVAPTVTPTGVSKDGSCGAASGLTCIGFIDPTGAPGECCSQYGWCGSSSDHCGTGCQSGFGTCGKSSSSSSAVSSSSAASSSAPAPASSTSLAPSSSSSSAVSSSSAASSSAPAPASTSLAPTSTPSVTSPDGSCGGGKGYTCKGFADGNCCSQYGWCGFSADHCGTGCNPLFGTCSGSSSSSVVASSAAVSSKPSPSTIATLATTVRPSSTSVRPSSTAKPTPTANVSKNGKCGKSNGGETCTGYGNLQCCSALGRCGSGMLACGLGCQNKFGTGCWF